MGTLPLRRYISHPKLSKLWQDDDFSVQLVIQVHIKSTLSLKYYFPKSVTVPYKHGETLEDDRSLPNERLEIKMSADEARELCEVVGLMIKVHSTDPYSDPCNHWWALTK